MNIPMKQKQNSQIQQACGCEGGGQGEERTGVLDQQQRNQRSNCQHPLDHGKSKRVPENIYFCFIDYAKAVYCVDHNKLWKILKKMGIPDHQTFLLRKLYAGQEATVRTGHGTTDWFQIGKGVHQDCITLLI